MAQAFVNSKIQPGKVVVFIKPTCPYCRKTQELLSQLPFKQGLLEFVDITATSNTSEIQDYLEQLTGARTVSLGSPAQRLGGRGEEGGRLPDAFVCDGWPVPSSGTPLGLRRSERVRGRAPETRAASLNRKRTSAHGTRVRSRPVLGVKAGGPAGSCVPESPPPRSALQSLFSALTA